MIQVCAACGTRWNVRDRRRVWCPRCSGTLLPPSTPLSGSECRPSASPLRPGRGPTPPRLPPGYRWIAVRPGMAPPPPGGRRPLGPTPRYAVIPRWGLTEHFDTAERPQVPLRRGPSIAGVRATLIATMAVLGVAALVHVVRYALLIVNRSVLLNPWLAWRGDLAGCRDQRDRNVHGGGQRGRC